MNQKRAKNLSLAETLKLHSWMKENVESFNGLSYCEVGRLAIAKKVVDRDEITKSQIERMAKEGGIRWEPPETTTTERQMENVAEDFDRRLKHLEQLTSVMTHQIARLELFLLRMPEFEEIYARDLDVARKQQLQRNCQNILNS